MEYLNATLEGAESTTVKLAHSVTRAADGEVIVKVVNFHNSSSHTLSLHVDDDTAGDSSHLQSSAPLKMVAASSVYGHAGDENSLDAPEKIRIRELAIDRDTAEVVLPPMSVSCVRLARPLHPSVK